MQRSLLILTVTVLCALVLAAGVVGAQARALAAEDGPPQTVLRKGKSTLQKGRQGSYCWTFDPGSGRCVDYMRGYPAVDRVEEDSRLYVRIFKGQRPGEFDLAAYRKVDEFDFPVGQAQEVAFRWRPVVRDGRTVAWDAVFKVNQPERHYYLSAFGIWKEGDSSWYFHVKTAG